MAFIHKHKQLFCFFIIIVLLSSAAQTSLAEESRVLSGPVDESTVSPEASEADESGQSTQESEPSPTQTVLVVQSEGGKISVSDEYAAEGDTVTITAVPDDGFVLEALFTNGVASPAGFTMGSESVIVSAVFVPSDESVSSAHSITVVQAANGTITVDKTSAVKGEKVKATYKPDDGYELKRIIINDAIVSRATFTMPDVDVVVTGLFVLKSTKEEKHAHSVTVTVTGQGSVEADCTEAYEGDKVTVDVAAGDGYVFESISFNGTACTDESPRYTLTMPDKDVEITAVFVEAPSDASQEDPQAVSETSLQLSTSIEVSIVTVVSVAVKGGMSGGVKAAIYIVPLLLIAGIAVMLLMRRRI